MIKVEVIEKFNLSLEKFNELKNIIRKSIDTAGVLYVGDTFECNKTICEYLTGKNPLNKVVVQVVEVVPENTLNENKTIDESAKPKNKKKHLEK